MGDSKFELVSFDKDSVVKFVNIVGNRKPGDTNPQFDTIQNALATTGVIKNEGAEFWNLLGEVKNTGVDSHDGRVKFLKDKFGIDENTTENYRIGFLRNSEGEMTLFKGHMDGDKKLVLTDSFLIPEDKTMVELKQMANPSFKPLPKPIQVLIENAKSVTNDLGIDIKQLELSPQEKTKLETQATFAAAIQKSGDVQLSSNAALPGKTMATGTSRIV